MLRDAAVVGEEGLAGHRLRTGAGGEQGCMRPGGALVGARRCACSLVPCGLLPRCGSGARATRPTVAPSGERCARRGTAARSRAGSNAAPRPGGVVQLNSPPSCPKSRPW